MISYRTHPNFANDFATGKNNDSKLPRFSLAVRSRQHCIALMSRLRQPLYRPAFHVLNPFVEARQSPIHGQGLFAKRLIRKGTRIIQYAGQKVDKDESNTRGLNRYEASKSDGGGAVYIFEVNDHFDIDGNFPWNIARLANHSCDPNCEVENDDDQIWVIALRDLQKGEEVTYDYGYDIEHFLEHPCRCGTERCVGYIVRTDQRRKLKRILKRSVNP